MAEWRKQRATRCQKDLRQIVPQQARHASQMGQMENWENARPKHVVAIVAACTESSCILRVPCTHSVKNKCGLFLFRRLESQSRPKVRYQITL